MNRELVDRPTPEYWFFFPELAKHWMSGTQVEQMTGRSGNKKWKCSIAIGNFKVEKWEKADKPITDDLLVKVEQGMAVVEDPVQQPHAEKVTIPACMTEQLKASRQGVTPLSHATQVVVTHKDVQLLQECHPDVKVAQWNIYKKQRSSRQVCDKKYKCLLCDSSWLRSTAEVAKHMDANHAHTAPVTTSLPTYGGGAPAPAQELEHTNGTAAAQPTAQFLGADAASAAATATAAQPAAQSTAQFPGADAASAAATATAAQPTAPPPCLGGAVLTGYAAAASIALPSSQGGAPAIPTSPSPSLGAFATAFATAASSHGTVVIPAAVSASPPSLQATAAATASTPVATHAASLNATSSHSLPEDTDTPGAGTGRTGGRGRLVREPHAHDLSPAGQESAHHNGSGGGGGGGVEDGSLAGSSAHGPGSSPDAPGMLASKVQAAPAGSECKVVSGKPGADAGAGGGVGGTHARQRRHGASGRRGGAGRRPRKPTRIARFSGKAHPPDTGVQVEEENEHGANNLTLNSDDDEEEEDRRSDDAGGGQQGECGADFKANFLHLPAPAAMDPIIITQTPAPTRVPTSAPLPQPGSALVHIKYDPLTSHQPAAPTPPPPPASGSPATPPSPTKAAPALQASPLAAPPPAAPPATTAAPTAPHAKATPVLQNAPPPPQRGMLSDACEGTSQQVACPSSVAGKQLCPTAPTAPPAPTTSGRHHNRDGHGDPETVLLNTAVGAVTNSDGHMKSRPEGCAEGAQVPKSLVSLPSQSSKGPPNHDSPSKRPCHLHLSPQRRQRREAYAGHSQQASQPVAVSSPNWGSAPRLQDHSLHAHTEAAAGLAGGGESERLEAGVWGASSVDTPRAGTAADAGADAGATGRESTPKASAGCAGTQAATENILSLLPLPKHPDDGALHPLQRACINNGSSCPLPKLSGSKRERAGASTGDDDDNDDGMPSPKQAKNVVQGRQFLDQMHPSVRDLESELTRAGAGVPGWPHALKLGETNTEGERQLAVLDTAAGAVKWLAGELVEAKKAQGELQLKALEAQQAGRRAGDEARQAVRAAEDTARQAQEGARAAVAAAAAARADRAEAEAQRRVDEAQREAQRAHDEAAQAAAEAAAAVATALGQAQIKAVELDSERAAHKELELTVAAEKAQLLQSQEALRTQVQGLQRANAQHLAQRESWSRAVGERDGRIRQLEAEVAKLRQLMTQQQRVPGDPGVC